MPNTSFGYPYPLPTDPVAEGAAAIQALAEAVNDNLAGPRRSIFSHADVSSPLNGALGNITNYTFNAIAGATYAMELTLFLTCGSSVPKAKIGWLWTGTGIMVSGQTGLDINAVAPSYSGPWTAHGEYGKPTSPHTPATGLGVPALTAGQCNVVKVYASYRCTTAGSVQARIQQITADATYPIVVRAGSWMTYERV